MKTLQTDRMLYLVYFIYFFNGLALCFEGAFNPEFKVIFNLGYTELMLTLFAKNLPFILFSIAIGHLALKLGFGKCLVIAVALFAAGTVLLIPGLYYQQYPVLLTGFFLIGTGFNFQLVAGNPLLSGLGNPDHSSSRLNLGNALGAISQILGPLIISVLIPTGIVAANGKIPYISGLFLAITVVLIATAGLSFRLLNNAKLTFTDANELPLTGNFAALFKNKILLAGFVAIFLAVGIEAGLFGLFRNFVENKGVAGLSSTASQRFFTVYFASFALGRIVGSLIQKKITAKTSLNINLIAAVACLTIACLTNGYLAIGFLLLTGFFISIFFPTIYAILINQSGINKAHASGFLTMGFLGAAVIPLLQGKMADLFNIRWALGISLIGYLFLFIFIFMAKKVRAESN